jgi:hypothetical protein
LRIIWDRQGQPRIQENQEVMAVTPKKGYAGKPKEKEGYLSADVNKCYTRQTASSTHFISQDSGSCG